MNFQKMFSILKIPKQNERRKKDHWKWNSTSVIYCSDAYNRVLRTLDVAIVECLFLIRRFIESFTLRGSKEEILVRLGRLSD